MGGLAGLHTLLSGMILSIFPSQTHSCGKTYYFCYFRFITERKILDRPHLPPPPNAYSYIVLGVCACHPITALHTARIIGLLRFTLALSFTLICLSLKSIIHSVVDSLSLVHSLPWPPGRYQHNTNKGNQHCGFLLA